jgi:hypothetical protein
MTTQLNLDGRDKVAESINRLRQYEPPEGYFLAFSGGKDSVVLYKPELTHPNWFNSSEGNTRASHPSSQRNDCGH